MEKTLRLNGYGRTEKTGWCLIALLLIVIFAAGVSENDGIENKNPLLMAKDSKAGLQQAPPWVTDAVPVTMAQASGKDEIAAENTRVAPVENVTENIMAAPGQNVTENIGNVPGEDTAENIVPASEESVTESTADVPDKDIAATVPDENITVTVPDEGEGNDVPETPDGTVNDETVSPFLIDDSGMIYGFAPEYADLTSGRLELPSEGCVGIRAGAFLDAGAGVIELFIPANLTQIETGAFAGLDELLYIGTDAGNTSYIAVDGVLFDSSKTVLLAFPCARVGGYSIPEGVIRIAEDAFYNSNLCLLDTRACKGIDISALGNNSMKIL